MLEPTWVEATLRVDPRDVDLVSDALHEAGAEGVSIEPAILISDSADFVYEELDAPSTVRASFSGPLDDGARVALEARLDAMGVEAPRYADVTTREWAEEWKRFYHVQHVGERLVVRPSWEPYEPQPHELVIELDPGTAFGTGQHETTRLCLIALDRLAREGEPLRDVLDVGAGSGILSIAAALLGAHEVRGMDNDAETPAIAQTNAALNGVGDRTDFATGSLGADWPWPERSDEACADLVICNISSTVVEALMRDIARTLRPGGLGVLSGFIARDLDEVRGVALEAGLRERGVEGEAEWRCLVVERPRA